MTNQAVVELVLKGFDGGTDATDDRIITVLVCGDGNHLEVVQAALESAGVANHVRDTSILDINVEYAAIDFRLPDELGELAARIGTFKRRVKLTLAKRIEEANLALLQNDTPDEDYYHSGASTEMGNLAFSLCMDNGVDLEDDGGYCNKATPIEISQYNLQRINQALAELSS